MANSKLAIGVLALVVGSVFAADEQQIAANYQRAVAGDKQAVEKCIALLEAAVSERPTDQVARVYLGSAYTLRSRDMSFGPAKLSTLNRGLATMDTAVAAAPENPRVRLVRALTTDSLPFFLGRRKSSRDDFEWLARAAAHSPEKFSSDDLATIRAHAAGPGR